MAPYPFILAAFEPPLADSAATADYAVKTPDPVKRRGPCEGFYGSGAVYGADGQLTTITITAPGAPTTVYGPAQTIHQASTQTLMVFKSRSAQLEVRLSSCFRPLILISSYVRRRLAFISPLFLPWSHL